jgi:hypothetical protein
MAFILPEWTEEADTLCLFTQRFNNGYFVNKQIVMDDSASIQISKHVMFPLSEAPMFQCI